MRTSLVLFMQDMYDFMALDRPATPTIDRGIALHKEERAILISWEMSLDILVRFNYFVSFNVL